MVTAPLLGWGTGEDLDWAEVVSFASPFLTITLQDSDQRWSKSAALPSAPGRRPEAPSLPSRLCLRLVVVRHMVLRALLGLVLDRVRLAVAEAPRRLLPAAVAPRAAQGRVVRPQRGQGVVGLHGAARLATGASDGPAGQRGATWGVRHEGLPGPGGTVQALAPSDPERSRGNVASGGHPDFAGEERVALDGGRDTAGDGGVVLLVHEPYLQVLLLGVPG